MLRGRLLCCGAQQAATPTIAVVAPVAKAANDAHKDYDGQDDWQNVLWLHLGVIGVPDAFNESIDAYPDI